ALRRGLPARARDWRAHAQERARDLEPRPRRQRAGRRAHHPAPTPRPSRERARRRLLRPKGDTAIMTDDETIQKLLDLKLATMAQAFRDLLADGKRLEPGQKTAGGGAGATGMVAAPDRSGAGGPSGDGEQLPARGWLSRCDPRAGARETGASSAYPSSSAATEMRARPRLRRSAG